MSSKEIHVELIEDKNMIYISIVMYLIYTITDRTDINNKCTLGLKSFINILLIYIFNTYFLQDLKLVLNTFQKKN